MPNLLLLRCFGKAVPVVGGRAGIWVVCGPRGAGKSHALTRIASAERSLRAAVHWVDATDEATWPSDGAVDVAVIDNVDPDQPDHVELVRTAVLAHRRGNVRRVVVATRSAELTDHLKFPWMHGVTHVGAADLALEVADVRAIAHYRGIRPGETMVAAIHSESRGWPWAALVGVSALRDLDPDEPDELRREIRSRIRATLAPHLSEQQRLVFAAAPSLDAELIGALGLGIADATTWLRAGEADGWLMRRSTESPYRVPTAVSAALSLDAERAPAALAGVRTRLGKHLVAQDRVREAVDVVAVSDDADMAAQVLHRIVALGRVSDLHPLALALRGRDQAWFADRLDLLVTTIVETRGANGSSDDWLRAALAQVSTAPRQSSALAHISFDAVKTVLHRVVGDLDVSVAQATRLMRRWREGRTGRQNIDGAAAVALEGAAAAFFYNGERRRTIAAETEAVDRSQDLPGTDLYRVSASTLAGMQAVQGDMAAAADALGRLPAHTTAPISDHARAWDGMSRALAGVEENAPDDARRHARAAVAAAADADNWWVAEYVHALTEHTRGARRVSGRYRTAVARGRSRGRTVHAPQFHRLRLCELTILDGSLDEARALVPDDDTGHRYAQLLNGVIDLALGSWAGAQRRASFDPADSWPRAAVLRGLVLTASSEALQQTTAAAEHLENAIDVMEERQLWSPLQFLTEQSRDLLLAAARRSPRRDELLRRLSIHPALPLARQPRSPLTTRERDVLRLLSGGSSRPKTAERLGVSLNTVKTLTARVYRKLEAQNLDEALEHAAEAGYLPPR